MPTRCSVGLSCDRCHRSRDPTGHCTCWSPSRLPQIVPGIIVPFDRVKRPSRGPRCHPCRIELPLCPLWFGIVLEYCKVRGSCHGPSLTNVHDCLDFPHLVLGPFCMGAVPPVKKVHGPLPDG